MSADLRVMNEDAFWAFEAHEKDRIHREYLARRIDTVQMRERYEALGESISLYVRFRLVLHIRGYVKTVNF